MKWLNFRDLISIFLADTAKPTVDKVFTIQKSKLTISSITYLFTANNAFSQYQLLYYTQVFSGYF